MDTTQHEEKWFWVYVLKNAEGKFYIEDTESLSARMKSHNRTDELFGK